MAHVEVHVSIRRDAQPHRHHRLYHVEFGTEHLCILVLLVVDMQLIVAAHLYPAAVVGYLQAVMRIQHRCVQRVLIVLDRVAVEPHQPVALEHSLRRRPVGLTALELVYISMVRVRELVETYVQHIASAQLHNRQRQPVVVHHHLQRLHLRVVHHTPRSRLQTHQ